MKSKTSLGELIMASSANKTATEIILGFRIVSPRWANDALSGEGARKFGGRWNSPGRPMVYLGGSRALAALEMLVHLTTPLSRAKQYQLIKVSIPTDLISDYPLTVLPKNWRDHPPTTLTQEIGDDWLRSPSPMSQLALRVPSTLIPEESNILLNPRHPDFKKVQSEAPVDFSFDQRL